MNKQGSSWMCSLALVIGSGCVADPGMDDGGQNSTTDAQPATDTEATTDTETGGEPPAACDMPDADVDATFVLALDAWPEDDDLRYDFAEDCTVDAVAVDDAEDATLTSLTCAGSLTATMRTARSEAGAVAWGAGDAVRIVARRDFQEGGYPAPLRFEMRLASDDSLLVGVSEDDDDDAQTGFAPIGIAIDSPCGVEDPVAWDPISLRVQFSGPGDESQVLFDRQQDVLVVDGVRFAIAVGAATTTSCCHAYRDVDILVQRVL